MFKEIIKSASSYPRGAHSALSHLGVWTLRISSSWLLCIVVASWCISGPHTTSTISWSTSVIASAATTTSIGASVRTTSVTIALAWRSIIVLLRRALTATWLLATRVIAAWLLDIATASSVIRESLTLLVRPRGIEVSVLTTTTAALKLIVSLMSLVLIQILNLIYFLIFLILRN